MLSPLIEIDWEMNWPSLQALGKKEEESVTEQIDLAAQVGRQWKLFERYCSSARTSYGCGVPVLMRQWV